MKLELQLARNKIVSPVSGRGLRLSADGGSLESDIGERFPIVNRTPILLAEDLSAYARSSDRMNSEYRGNLAHRIKSTLMRDYRTKASVAAFEKLFQHLGDDALCLSVGGGPLRSHPLLVNVNIDVFDNVDIVADAHRLPYETGSVDVVHCSAVLEHLKDPHQAVTEMFRVLKPGGRVFADTPFMQAYHAYPNHFQNFTATGHALIFERAGFSIIESGCSVGPVCAVATIVSTFLREYFPRPLNKILQALWWTASLVIRPLDLIFANKPNAHVLASTTYVLAVKP